MVLIDLFIILILVASTMLGIKDGFFKKVFGVLGFWGGFVLASPVIFYHIWRFVSPGLYRRERKIVLVCIAAAAMATNTSALRSCVSKNEALV